jgi:hypothetical protein
MEKRIEAPGEKQPIKGLIDKLLSEQKQLKATADALKPFYITGEAFVLVKLDKVLVIHERAVRQLEELGKMSLRISSSEVPELSSLGIGREYGKVSMVDEFILPSKVLALKDNAEISELVELVIGQGREQDIKRLKSNEESLKAALMEPHIEIDDIVHGKWEMIASPTSVAVTKHYLEKFRASSGILVPTSYVHVHGISSGGEYLEWNKPSVGDILSNAGYTQFFEWFGILGVSKDMLPQDFKVGKENLKFFYSNIENITPLKKLNTANLPPDVRTIGDIYDEARFAKTFARTQGAKLMTYEELLGKVG